VNYKIRKIWHLQLVATTEIEANLSSVYKTVILLGATLSPTSSPLHPVLQTNENGKLTAVLDGNQVGSNPLLVERILEKSGAGQTRT
jgi:hypothetical protein